MPEHAETAGASPEIQARIRASFARQGLMRTLGAVITRIEDGRVHIDLPVRPEVSQQHGYVHAGATSAIADSAGGYAGLTRLPTGSEVLTVAYTLNLVAPATGDHLEAIGTVIRTGRTLTVCRMEVFGVRDATSTLVAVGQQTLIRIEGGTD